MPRDNRSPEQVLADREAKIAALQDKLTSAVESLITGEDWRRAIEFAAMFRSRSFNNTLLIWMQHTAAHAEGRVPEPFPTHVAGFQQWRELGRQVMKGQSGYQIMAPVTARMASAEPDNTHSWRTLGRGEQPSPGEVVRSRMVGIKPAYVWDISMTQGPPVPELPAPQLLTGHAPEGMWDGLAQIADQRGFTLHDAPDATYLNGANGMTRWSNRTVHVRADMDDAARARTLSHEVGHIVLHDPENTDAVLHRGIAEVEAESVALMIGAAHGMDTTQYTIPYVATWASQIPGQDPLKTIGDTASRIRTAALGILESLDTPQGSDGNPPEWCRKELGHVLLHGPDQTPRPRHVAEVEAESVAYVVGAAAGLPTEDYSVPYVAGWANGDLDVLHDAATRVLATARQIIDRAGPPRDPLDTRPTPLGRDQRLAADRSTDRLAG